MNEQLILEQLQKLNENMNQGFQSIREEMGTLGKRMDSMENRVQGLENRIQGLENRVQSIEDRMQSMEDRMQSMESSIQRLDAKIDHVEKNMIARQEQFEEHMLAEFQNVLRTIDAKFLEYDKKLEEAIHEVKVYMEVAVGNRVTALFDGYEIEHSHRVTLERNTGWLKRQVEEIQTRLAVLEDKHSA